MQELSPATSSLLIKLDTLSKQLITDAAIELRAAYHNFAAMVSVSEKEVDPVTKQLDPVTNLDQDLELRFYDAIHKQFPEVGFSVEEHSELNIPGKEITCLMDPIDGTRYFARELPLFAIQIGFSFNNEPVSGHVCIPVMDEYYQGTVYSPATLNGKRIAVSQNSTLEKSVVNVQLTSGRQNWEAEKEALTMQLQQLFYRVNKVRMIYSSAVSAVWTAKGGFDAAVWLTNDHDYDLFPGLAIIAAASGKYTAATSTGFNSPHYIAGNPELVDLLGELLV